MNGIYYLIAIAVGILSIVGVFFKLAYQLGQMSEQLKDVIKAIDGITQQVKELFDWRYESAVRDQKRR